MFHRPGLHPEAFAQQLLEKKLSQTNTKLPVSHMQDQIPAVERLRANHWESLMHSIFS
jgi:hypothetical protein